MSNNYFPYNRSGTQVDGEWVKHLLSYWGAIIMSQKKGKFFFLYAETKVFSQLFKTFFTFACSKHLIF